MFDKAGFDQVGSDPVGFEPVLAIHGGAGTLAPDAMDAELDQAHRAGLTTALRAGYRVLAAGGPALDAVTAAVQALENDALFNAGHGAVLTAAGTHEMDACVMDGATRRVGAVAAICGPRSPILAARAVLEHSPHILLAGRGAEDWLRSRVEFVDPSYFRTARREQALQTVLAAAGGALDDADRHGTVGAVARDRSGRLAAATSTGGMTGKRPGRIGDTPLPGAGTWADGTVAISATGHGESFIRAAAGHALSARIQAGESLEQAALAVLADVESLGGDGGLVAVDAAGHVTLSFNSRGMYRGMVTADGVCRTGIYHGRLT